MTLPSRLLVLTLLTAASGFLTSCMSASVDQQNVNWSVYLGDSGRRHYSKLTQITPDNVNTLELAWAYDSGNPRSGNSTMYTSPLVVDGVFYGLSPTLTAFALNAATGKELWRHDPGVPSGPQRGLMWWERNDEQRLLYTAGRYVIALHPTDGSAITDFGINGQLDLMPPERTGSLRVTVPGIVFDDMLIFGFSTLESDGALPGSIRAFDAVDGHLLWQFDSIPKPGELGSETWADGTLENAGGANTWTGFTLDEERELLFVPTGSSTPDFYGGRRHGDNLFANSVLALDARTGERKWHYQVWRHDIWDRDFPSPPTLVQLVRDGTTIDGVAVTTKSGHLWLFDRETGKPLYDVIEETTLPSNLPGESPAPTQPVSAMAFTRQAFELTNRNPEATAFVQELIKDFDLRPWAPPSLNGTLMYPGYDGGAEWGGSAFDPATNRLILNASEIGSVVQLHEIPIGHSNRGVYAEHCASCHGLDLTGTAIGPSLVGVFDRIGRTEISAIVQDGRARMPPFDHLSEVQRRGVLRYLEAPGDTEVNDTPTTEVRYAHGGYVWVRDHEGLPGNTPPWGTLNSIDLASGDIVWQVPFGNYPEHEELGFGAESYGGPIVTATGLIFIGATPDRQFRAYGTANGDMLWETELPAAAYTTPVTYSVDGVQYVAISAGGGKGSGRSSSEYLAYRLPSP